VRQVVHSFERGTEIHNIMDKFGGSAPKGARNRSSFPFSRSASTSMAVPLPLDTDSSDLFLCGLDDSGSGGAAKTAVVAGSNGSGNGGGGGMYGTGSAAASKSKRCSLDSGLTAISAASSGSTRVGGGGGGVRGHGGTTANISSSNNNSSNASSAAAAAAAATTGAKAGPSLEVQSFLSSAALGLTVPASSDHTDNHHHPTTASVGSSSASTSASLFIDTATIIEECMADKRSGDHLHHRAGYHGGAKSTSAAVLKHGWANEEIDHSAGTVTMAMARAGANSGEVDREEEAGFSRRNTGCSVDGTDDEAATYSTSGSVTAAAAGNGGISAVLSEGSTSASASMSTSAADTGDSVAPAAVDTILFTELEIMGLRLMFSLFDR
jgi:trimeric autotransporter adhesin